MRAGALIGTALSLALAMPAAAGGWASVVDDRVLPPDDEGSTIVRFTLLQHGETPVDWGELSVVATHQTSGRQVSGTARREPDTAGGWIVTFPLPEAGSWTIAVRHSELEITTAGPLRITAAPRTGAGSPAGGAPALPAAPEWLGVALLVVALAPPGVAAVALAVRRRTARPAGAPPTSA